MPESNVIDDPKTAPQKSPPKLEKLPPFHLVLHNDDVNDMGHVVDSLTTVTPVGTADARKIMLTAHFHGRAVVMTTHRERAELYRDRLRSKSLVATVEPAE